MSCNHPDTRKTNGRCRRCQKAHLLRVLNREYQQAKRDCNTAKAFELYAEIGRLELELDLIEKPELSHAH